MGNAWTNQNITFLVIPTGATTGARITINVADDGAILVYNTAGQLFESIASAAGTDTFGNAYPEGFAVGVPDNPQVVITVAADGKSGLVIFPTGSTHMADSAALQAFQQGGTGAGSYDLLQILSAKDNTELDSVVMTWQSSSNDGTTNAQFQAYYSDPLGTLHLYMMLGFAGLTIEAGAITAVQPGTGTSRAVPAVAETWHPLAGLYANGWSDFGGTEQVGRYQKDATGRVWLDGDLAPGTYVTLTTICILPVGYRPIEERVYEKQPVGVGGGAYTINILPTGIVQLNNVVGGAPGIVGVSDISFPTT
jgi:hypothetical protein